MDINFKLFQLVGYSDEILDVAYLGYNDSHIALATNSCDIKLYEIASMDCQLLCGHTDSVLALGITPANVNLLVSSAKVFIFFNMYNIRTIIVFKGFLSDFNEICWVYRGGQNI